MKKPSFFQRSELSEILWTFRREFVIVGIFSMVANVLLISPTLYMLQIYDRVLASQSELTLLAMSILTLALFGIMAFAEWMRSRVLIDAGLRLDRSLSTRVFNASFESYLEASASTPSRAFADLIQVRQFLTGNGILAFLDFPWAPVYIAVTFALHPYLGCLSLLFVLFQLLLGWLGHRNTVGPSDTVSKANNEVNAYLHSKLRNAEVIESMGMLGGLKQRWSQRRNSFLREAADFAGFSHRVVAWSKFIRYTQQSLSLAAGALLVIDGQLSPGGMIAANVLMTRALAPIDLLVTTWPSFAAARSAFARLEDLLKIYPERDAALTRVAPKGEVQVRDLFALAPGRASPILKKINFKVVPGTITVVLGPSGSGKSTLARALLGIWPDIAGEVLLDGLPIQGWNRSELGPHVGYLPQDVELFSGTVADNISRFGELNPERVIEAARCAGLHEMILQFPNGYDTPIGDAGGVLSGGQRQRIGLARAVYGNPSLIILDEPNANLDDAGEKALMQTVEDMKAKGKTVFLITHRQGAIAAADRLMILVDGELRADGPRDAVLQAIQREQQALAAKRQAPPPDQASLQPA